MVCGWCVLLGVGVAWLVYKLVDWALRLPTIGTFSDRYIFITGCDTGFGNATAKKLDGLGCHVIAGCLTETGETDLRKACSSRLHTLRLDVSKPDSVSKAYQQVIKLLPKGKGLWGVLNNAGISGKIGPADWLKLDDYKQVLDVNFYGLVDVSRTFLPLLKLAKGRIVNTASVFGRFSMAGSGPYCVSKFCVEAFSDALRREMHVFDVSVHLIEPGFHKTPITDLKSLEKSLLASWQQTPDEIKKEYGQEYCDNSVKTLLQSFVSGIITEDISGVVDAYTHALLGRVPRLRYVIGRDAHFLWIPVTRLPTLLGDLALKMMVKNPPIPAACT